MFSLTAQSLGRLPWPTSTKCSTYLVRKAALVLERWWTYMGVESPQAASKGFYVQNNVWEVSTSKNGTLCKGNGHDKEAKALPDMVVGYVQSTVCTEEHPHAPGPTCSLVQSRSTCITSLGTRPQFAFWQSKRPWNHVHPMSLRPEQDFSLEATCWLQNFHWLALSLTKGLELMKTQWNQNTPPQPTAQSSLPRITHS